MEEEKIAQGTYDFRVMREDGYRYVDKTALLYPRFPRWSVSSAVSANSSRAWPSIRWTMTGPLTPSYISTSVRWM